MDIASLPVLPVSHVLADIGAALESQRRAVLSAPPGAGKTTLVPLFLLEQSWRGDGKIILLEPRRLAARAAATNRCDRSSGYGERVICIELRSMRAKTGATSSQPQPGSRQPS